MKTTKTFRLFQLFTLPKSIICFYHGLWIFLFASCAYKNEKADLILHNARIYTVDADFSIKEAMAVKDGIIIAIGPEREIMNKYDAPKIIDAQKRPVFPGLFDAHCHILAYGRTLQEVDLVGTRSFDEVISRVSDYSKKFPDKKWIIGRGWDQNDWPNPAFPNKHLLDSLFPNTPVMLQRIDGHASLVNNAALLKANLTSAKEIFGGEIQTDASGKLTGILIDNAMNLVSSLVPEPTEQENIEAWMAAQAACFSHGITTVDDAGLMLSDIQLIKKLHEEQKLKLRIYAMMSDDTSNFNYYFKHGIDTTERLTVRAFKFYADGALGSRGACLLSPYDDLLPKKHFGKMLNRIEHFRARAYDLRKHGFQMCTHAIGDSANRVILDLYGEVWDNANADHRWRIEHAQVVHQNDIKKFRQYHVIPSVQPTHATSDMPWAAERLGRNRVYRAYTYKELLEQLGMLALGTDCPVEGISPFATFYAAIARKDKNGNPAEGWQMENAISREDALRGMTIWAAISNFEEHHKGSLEIGKFADFVLLDRDILQVPDDAILNTEVITTVLNGEVVYQRK